MKRRQFDKLCAKVLTRKRLDITKFHVLTNEERTGMVEYIVRYRGPVIIELIPEGFDMSWLHSMGYIYETKGKDYNWIHNSETTVK